MKKIADKSLFVGVIGLGYVGLPLAVIFARKGISIVGFEKSAKKVEAVNAGKNYIGDIKDEDLAAVVSAKKLGATTDFSRIAECDAVIICVPTPLDKFKKPDMSYIEAACEEIGHNMKKGTFISLESTTYPTTTEDLMKPIIERNSGMKEGTDFWLCFSPNGWILATRITRRTTPPRSSEDLGRKPGNSVGDLRNRDPEALPGEFAPSRGDGQDPRKHLPAREHISHQRTCAARRQDGYQHLGSDRRGQVQALRVPGLLPRARHRGHCIPLDPFYLEYIAKGLNFDLTMINTAGNINNLMPYRMMNKIAFALNRHSKALNGSTILFLGIAYKPDIDDPRESPALLVMEQVAKKGAKVSFHDPYIAEATDDHGHKWVGVKLTDEALAIADCVVFTTNHSCFDVDHIVSKAKLVVDTRNAVKRVHIEDEKVFKL